MKRLERSNLFQVFARIKYVALVTGIDDLSFFTVRIWCQSNLTNDNIILYVFPCVHHVQTKALRKKIIHKFTVVLEMIASSIM